MENSDTKLVGLHHDVKRMNARKTNFADTTVTNPIFFTHYYFITTF